MPYVTSIEKFAKNEGKAEGTAQGRAEGKIQLLQDLLGLPVTPDAELDCMTGDQLNSLLTNLRQRFDAS